MPPPKRLLVVDDEELNRDMLGRRLIRSGYDVRLAGSGKEALAIVAGEPIDMVLLDVMMPGMSGLDVLHEIRQHRPSWELPVVMVSASQETEGVVAALRAGANDYIVKPVDFVVAQARIEAGLRLAVNDREQRRRMELYRLASVASDQGMWDWDLRAGAIEYSESWKAMLGIPETRSPAIPRNGSAASTPPTGRAWRTKCAPTWKAAPAAWCRNTACATATGSWRWFENRGGAARDGGGQAHPPGRMPHRHHRPQNRRSH